MSDWPGLEPAHGAVDPGRLQALGGRQRRQDRGQPLGQQRLAGARRADHQDVVAASSGDQESALGVVLSFDVDEVLVRVGMLGEQLVEIDGLRVHVNLSGQEADGFSQAADGIDVEALDDGGFGGIGPGNEQPVATFEHGLKTHRQDALDGAGLAGESQFAHDGIVAGPVEADLTAAHQEPQRDRQVEAVGVFLQVGRSEVDHHPVDRAGGIRS